MLWQARRIVTEAPLNHKLYNANSKLPYQALSHASVRCIKYRPLGANYSNALPLNYTLWFMISDVYELDIYCIAYL